MASQPGRESYEGLASLAHAIRRSTALYVAAAYVCEPSDSIDTLEQTADRLARWIGGQAAQQPSPDKPPPIGKPFPPPD